MIAAIRPIGLITHSKNFLIMHAPTTGIIREIMHEIILQSTAELSEIEIYRSACHAIQPVFLRRQSAINQTRLVTIVVHTTKQKQLDAQRSIIVSFKFFEQDDTGKSKRSTYKNSSQFTPK